MAAMVAMMLASASVSHAEPLIAAGPQQAGEMQPASGQSLFDELFARGRSYDLPYPFERFAAAVQRHNDGVRPRQVLIPMGRSLQRLTADPDYFASPRVVLGVDAAGAKAAHYLKDRLYIGYQARSESMEVISYNEGAGRFEFQLVSNYSAVGKPLVEYADRSLCTSCHQGHGPIFPIAQWNETNANPRIAERLSPLGRAHHGVPVRRGIDEPDALDQSIGRANRLPLAQFVWQRACGAAHGMTESECRTRLLLAALRWRLGGARGVWTGDAELATALQAAFSKLAPGGLAIPNPSLPDRDPLIELDAGGVPMEVVEPEGVYDPALLRAPRMLTAPSDTQGDLLAAAVSEIGGFFSPHAIARLAAALAEQGGATEIFAAPCTVSTVAGEARFDCSSEGVSVSGYASPQGGTVTRLTLKGYTPLTGLKVLPGARGRAMALALVENAYGLPARLPSGERLSALRIANGKATITVTDDIVHLRRAIAALDMTGDGPLQAAVIGPALVRAISAERS